MARSGGGAAVAAEADGTGERMSEHGSALRKVFHVELPERVAAMLRIVESRAGEALVEARGDLADVGPVVGFFDDTGKPSIAVAEKKGKPSAEALAIEVARLHFRGGRFEKNMPYAEMRHQANQRLCRRLFRVIEQEVILGEVEAMGLGARAWVRERMASDFLGALATGKYRKGEADPGRLREGALDALEAAIAEVEAAVAKQVGLTVAEHDPGISRTFGLMYKAVERHRPFDAFESVRAAYYLTVPFLFDARKPSAPIFKTKPG